MQLYHFWLHSKIKAKMNYCLRFEELASILLQFFFAFKPIGSKQSLLIHLELVLFVILYFEERLVYKLENFAGFLLKKRALKLKI